MIQLQPHRLENAEQLSKLSSHEKIRQALGLSEEQTSVEGTKAFISFVNEEEREGNVYSRGIVYKSRVVGVITLKNINKSDRTSHIGTWVGHPYWGLGINEEAKKKIFIAAFDTLNLERVFAGAKKGNIRSIKAQEKLPYVQTNVGDQFPDQLEQMIEEYGTACVLNVIEKRDFDNWLFSSS